MLERATLAKAEDVRRLITSMVSNGLSAIQGELQQITRYIFEKRVK